MEKNPFFSVIVPVYNVENYLEQCLESICHQSYDAFEVILVDDGSTDLCPQICDRFAQINSKIKVIHKENQGLVEARKTGVSLAKGEYIVFVDSDDWIESDMLENCYRYLEDSSIEVLVLDYYLNSLKGEERYKNLINSGEYMGEKLNSEIKTKMLYSGEYYVFGIVPSVWSKIFKAELLRKNIYRIDQKITMGEDVALTYPCLSQAKKVRVIDEAYYHYRFVDNSMSKDSGVSYFDKIEVLFEWLDKNQSVIEEEQIKMYKVMMFCLGMERMFLWESSLVLAIKKMKEICQRELYRKLLKEVEVIKIRGNDQKNIAAIINNFYISVYVRYSFKRLKIKVKKLFKG